MTMQKKDEALEELLTNLGYEQVRYIEGRGYCGLYRFMFTVGVCINMDATGLQGRICFDTWQNAELFFKDWDGETEPVIGEDGCTAIKVRL